MEGLEGGWGGTQAPSCQAYAVQSALRFVAIDLHKRQQKMAKRKPRTGLDASSATASSRHEEKSQA